MDRDNPAQVRGCKQHDLLPIPGLRKNLDFLTIKGERPGPTVLINAAVHGNEIVGIQIIRKVYESIRPRDLSGNLLLVPVVNKPAFQVGERYLPEEGLDMNRAFPGSPVGRKTEKIAFVFFDLACSADAIIDLHSLVSPLSMVPHVRIRVRERTPRYNELIAATGMKFIWEGVGIPGMLQLEASKKGIPCATIEIGISGRFSDEEVAFGFATVKNILRSMEMIQGKVRRPEEIISIQDDIPWTASPISGLFQAVETLGNAVRRGATVGKVLNTETMKSLPVRAPFAGIVVGLRINTKVEEGEPVALVTPL